MKKNILILSLSLCIFLTAQPVYAVKLAPVNAPNSGPLQPIPEGVEPNIKSNIQDKTQSEESENPENNFGQVNSTESGKQAGESSNVNSSSVVSKNNSGVLIIALVIVVILLVLGMLWYRKMQSKKQ